MALDPIVNFFRSTIATLPVASGGTSIVLQTGDGNKLPAPAIDGAFNLTIYNADDPFVAPEIVRVTARSGDTLTVTRAQEGTSATNKTAGSTWNVELTPTAKTIQDIDSTKLDVADVVDNLTSTDTDKALSANQGKVLQDGKLNLSGGTLTGDLTIPDKIIHSGDTDTAIRFPANDTVSVETNGTEKIRATSTAVVVNESGLDQDFRVEGDTNANLLFVDASTDKVGIGTNAPANELHVAGVAHADTSFTVGIVPNKSGTVIDDNNTSKSLRITADPGSVGANSYIAFNVDGSSEKMRIKSTGFVGIGTTTPATTLDVNGDVTITDKIIHSGDTNTAIRFPANDTVTVETAGVSRLVVGSTGNIGMGKDPVYKLDVLSASTAVFNLASAVGTDTVIRFEEDSDPRGYIGYDQSKGVIKISGTNAFSDVDHLVIDSAGKVGIGTSNPAYRFDIINPAGSGLKVSGSDISTNALISGATRGARIGANSTTSFIEGVDNTGVASFQPLTIGGLDIRFAVQGVANEKMRITSTGNVEIANGNLKFSTNGTGIDFSSVAGGGASSSVLDDYERGTFTPTVIGLTTAGTGTYSVQFGRYIKIGKLVTAFVRLSWSAHNGTGNLAFDGLPFTVLSTGNYLSSASIGIISDISMTANNIATGFARANTTRVEFFQTPTGGGSTAAVPIDTSASINFTVTYETA